MNFEYEGCYAQDEPAAELMRAGVLLPDMDDMTARTLITAWKMGFDRGADYIQKQWDHEEELRYESEQGWDI